MNDGVVSGDDDGPLKPDGKSDNTENSELVLLLLVALEAL